jgi:hypothetical protein
MKAGGFDAVIGNPPYVRQETLGEKFKEYAAGKYTTYAGTADLYVYFFERAHQVLRQGGLFGMICSNKFMRANYGKALRDYLAKETQLAQIVDFGELPVFQNAATFPAVFLTYNGSTKNQKFIYAAMKRLNFKSLSEEVDTVGSKLDNRALMGDNWTLANSDEIEIIGKIKKAGVPLGNYAKALIYYGIKTGYNEAFVIDGVTRKNLVKEDKKSKEIIKPFVNGDDIRKYRINYQDRYLIFTRHGIDIKKYTAIYNYLLPYKERLIPKPKNWKGKEWKGRKPGAYEWYEIQDTIDYFTEFEKPKIIYPEIAKESRFALDKDKYYLNKTCFLIPVEDYFLLGILNSKVAWFFLKRLCSVLGDADKSGRLLQQKIYIETLPIRPIDRSSTTDKYLSTQIVSLVTSILDLNKKLPLARDDQEKTLLARQIDSTDRQIDKLVYELYGLTEEEIKIVEGGGSRSDCMDKVKQIHISKMIPPL